MRSSETARTVMRNALIGILDWMLLFTF